MLKLTNPSRNRYHVQPAAFRRLCVETLFIDCLQSVDRPAAFRRLCVETGNGYKAINGYDPAAFRRLCVETPQ